MDEFPGGSFGHGLAGLAAGAARSYFNARRKAAKARERAVRDAQNDPTTGQRYAKDAPVYKKYKRFDIDKVGRGTIDTMHYILGGYELPAVSTTIGTVPYKYLVSEFNPGTGGMVPIAQRSKGATDNVCKSLAPLHIYDLNFCSPETRDTQIQYPVIATSQCQDINSRMWTWSKENQFVSPTGSAMQSGNDPWASSLHIQPRWQLQNMEGAYQTNNSLDAHLNRFYRKSIDIRMILYGCEKLATEFDVRIIQIMDPKMCPDYPVSLSNVASATPGTSFSDLDTFKSKWSDLVRPWVINPALRDVERQTAKHKPWFRTVLKKRVTMGEQVSTVENIPCREIALHLDINELNDTRWDDTGYTLKAGNTAYDNVPDGNVTDGQVLNNNLNGHEKVWFTKRYYLMIRAMSPSDVSESSGQDVATGIPAAQQWKDNGSTNWNPTGLVAHNYIPSYDLIARTYFMTNMGVA